MDKLLLLEELASLWKVDPEIVQAHVKAGRLKGINIGIDKPEWRFHPDDIVSCLDILRENSGLKLHAPPNTQACLPLPGLYRLNIKPQGAMPGSDPRAFCLQENIAGMGWAVETAYTIPLDWDTYRQKATAQYTDGSWGPVITFHDAPDRSVIWTRCGNKQHTIFFSGLVIGPWVYRNDVEARAADIVNTRPVIWQEIGGYDAVPTSIAKAFTPITFSAIRQMEAIEFTGKLTAQLISNGIWPD